VWPVLVVEDDGKVVQLRVVNAKDEQLSADITIKHFKLPQKSEQFVLQQSSAIEQVDAAKCIFK
jgi:hypothetical protein